MEVARQPGLGDPAVKRHLGQGFGDNPADLDKLVEIDAHIAAHRFEEERGVFHDDVAGRAGRIRATAKPAERGVELAAAGVVRREHIGDAEPARVVEMRRDGQRGDIGDDLAEDALDRRRLAVTDRVGEDDPVGAGFGRLIGDASHALFVDIALDRAAERGGECAIDLYLLAALPAQRDDTAEIFDRLLGRSPHVREIVAV
jgi:hypothetical protein